MVDDERPESARDFKSEDIGYITFMFEDTYDSRFRMWAIQKYKELTYFIKKLCVCDMYVISQEELITYESLVQEAMQ